MKAFASKSAETTTEFSPLSPWKRIEWATSGCGVFFRIFGDVKRTQTILKNVSKRCGRKGSDKICRRKGLLTQSELQKISPLGDSKSDSSQMRSCGARHFAKPVVFLYEYKWECNLLTHLLYIRFKLRRMIMNKLNIRVFNFFPAFFLEQFLSFAQLSSFFNLN